MFSALAGMPLSEYVRRRRMTVAAADVVRGEQDLLHIAVRHGYGSTEAFGRAFRAAHGAGPGEVRRDGRPAARTTTPQVPSDRRRERPHGHPHRRPSRISACGARRPRTAGPPGDQPAHPAAHHRPAAGGAPTPEGARRHRAGRPARGHAVGHDPDAPAGGPQPPEGVEVLGPAADEFRHTFAVLLAARRSTRVSSRSHKARGGEPGRELTGPGGRRRGGPGARRRWACRPGATARCRVRRGRASAWRCAPGRGARRRRGG